MKYVLIDGTSPDKKMYVRKDWETFEGNVYTQDINQALVFESFEEAATNRYRLEKIEKLSV